MGAIATKEIWFKDNFMGKKSPSNYINYSDIQVEENSFCINEDANKYPL
jgi:hypothetical protein